VKNLLYSHTPPPAQHVIFIEPLLNTAVEAQAIGRVHRISQTRPTTVHRFAVAGSIEEGLLWLRYRNGANGRSTLSGGAPSAGASPAKGAGKVMAEESQCLTWDELEILFPRSGSVGTTVPALTSGGQTAEDMDD
jgi:hypothetical protein